MLNKAVFIDRDGTISKSCSDESRVGKIELDIFSYSAEAIRLLNLYGFKIIVVTNQPGIGKGLFNVGKVNREHTNLYRYMAAHGAFIDAVYCCPHKEEDRCDCRKPNTGMLLRAAIDYGLDMPHSYIIGDSWRDVEAGRRVGLTTLLIKGQHNRAEYVGTYLVNNLIEAAWKVLDEQDIVFGRNR